MQSLSVADRQKVIREMLRLPRWVQDNADSIELGSHWTDMETAAALLSRTSYMPYLTPRVDDIYPPATLKAIIRKLDASGRVFVIYMIGGDPTELRRLRFLYLGGCLYVHPLERIENRDKLVGIYIDAKEAAASFARQTEEGQNVRHSQP
jgi:hypothetical protein